MTRSRLPDGATLSLGPTLKHGSPGFLFLLETLIALDRDQSGTAYAARPASRGNRELCGMNAATSLPVVTRSAAMAIPTSGSDALGNGDGDHHHHHHHHHHHYQLADAKCARCCRTQREMLSLRFTVRRIAAAKAASLYRCTCAIA
jgi:ABC-type nickel/cobalt efflux system permease component RcnA